MSDQIPSPAGPAYIISAYHRPELLLRLVDELGAAPIAIHIDTKSKIKSEVIAGIPIGADVTMLPQHRCYWGLIGHVKASLEGLKWFKTTSATHAILLTGQCFPIVSLDHIKGEVEKLGQRSVIEIEPFPRQDWMRYERGGYDRLDGHYFHIPTKIRPRALRFGQRTVPYGLHPYGGSGYWCLSRIAVDYILEFIQHNPNILSFFKRTFVPDEMFFHTIIGNSSLSCDLINRPIHYFDFSMGGPNPALMTDEAVITARRGPYWFARKFQDLSLIERVSLANKLLASHKNIGLS